MSAHEVDARLCARLAELYPQAETVSTLARRASIDPAQLRLSGPVADQWGALVQAVRARGATAALIADALVNEAGDAELTALLAEERSTARQRRRSLSREGAPVSPTSDDLLHQVAQDIAVMQRDLHYTKAEIEELRRALERLPPGYMTLQVLVGLLVLTQIGVIVFMAVTHL